MRLVVPMAALAWALVSPAWAADITVHHEMAVRLEPEQGRINVSSRLRLPPALIRPGATPIFSLHAGLQPRVLNADVTLEAVGMPFSTRVPLARYRVRGLGAEEPLELVYSGRIRHPLPASADPGDRVPRATPGLIDDVGVYLDGGSFWYPRFQDETVTFSLRTSLPEGWHSVSQGALQVAAGSAEEVWVERIPQDEIYLVAGPLQRYREPGPHGEAQVFLRGDDPSLARRYLDATAHYLDLYSRLLGPYPFAKFALVENFWESGFGMPSFTLLGSRVLRLPFILDSSYPHEILHNWWGNGVLVDYPGGNWSEGLTSYLADYLLAEAAGRGLEYRRGALQKYADYVAVGEDFPLTDFRARHGEVTQAVGYNKALMFFHMLRLELGETAFIEALRRFYTEEFGRLAGFGSLQQRFEAVSGRDLAPYFAQWVERPGAPSLAVEDTRVTEVADGYRLSFRLVQRQNGPEYHLRVPVALVLRGQRQAFETEVRMEGRNVPVELLLPGKPLRLLIDPAFDIFRRLDPLEVPPSVGRMFGAKAPLAVLPDAASEPLRSAYRQLAGAWVGDAATVWDRDLAELPRDRAVWILGWENRHRADAERLLEPYGVAFDASTVASPEFTVHRDRHSAVLIARQPERTDLAVGWIGADSPESLSALTRRLPHYSKYSYLSFAGQAGDNLAKGQWQGSDSPLNVPLAPEATRVPVILAPRPTLAGLVAGRSEPSKEAYQRAPGGGP